MENRLKVFRYRKDDRQTFGEGQVVGPRGRLIFKYAVLELPWKNNQQMISCIPPGIYPLRKCKPGENGSRFKYWHFEIMDVKGRDKIKIHIVNHFHEILGCQGVGSKFVKDFDHDGEPDLTQSKVTLARLVKFLPLQTTIEIIDVTKPNPKPLSSSIPTTISTEETKKTSEKKMPIQESQKSTRKSRRKDKKEKRRSQRKSRKSKNNK